MNMPDVLVRPQQTDVLRHAADIDRQADQMLAVGRHTQAERLAHLAADLRQEVLA
jgi:hypothetical protein